MSDFCTTVSENISCSDVAVLICLHKTAFPEFADSVI